MGPVSGTGEATTAVFSSRRNSRSRGVASPAPARPRGSCSPFAIPCGPAELSTQSPCARKIPSPQRERRTTPAFRDTLRAGGTIHAVAARAEEAIVAARNKIVRPRLRDWRQGQSVGFEFCGVGQPARAGQPIDQLVARRSGDAKDRLGRGNGVILSGGDAIVLTRLLPWKQPLNLAGRAPVDDIQVAGEVRTVTEAHPVVPVKNQPWVYQFPKAVLQALHRDFHAIPGLRGRVCFGYARRSCERQRQYHPMSHSRLPTLCGSE